MSKFNSFKNFTSNLNSTELMPVLFIGHGSPMNGIEMNEFSTNWAKIAKGIPIPAAIVVVSAHWLTKGTKITAMDFPSTIHDFGGFPQALFDVEYPAPGNPQLAQEMKAIFKTTSLILDHDWGLDHGAWTIAKHMYPNANIPMLQLSIDYTKDANYHYNLAKELSALRSKGVLILASGNMVHNLKLINWDMMNGGGYDWAIDIDSQFKELIVNKDHSPLINFGSFGAAGKLAIPTPEHYLPLMYALGLQQLEEEAEIFNDQAIGGSLTMTSVMIH